MRLLLVLLETSSFKEFEEKIGKSNIKHFYIGSEIQKDEACEVSSKIWLDSLSDDEFDNVDSMSSLKECLSLLSMATKGFSCRL